MIRSFRHKGLAQLSRLGKARYIRPDLVARLLDVLSLLEVATHPRALDLPGLRLHRLRGDRDGQWSVTVSANWRVVFRFEDGDVHDVDLVDYH